MPVAALMGAGVEFAGVVLLLAWIGWWLDAKWSTQPILLLMGVGSGIVGETYKLWRIGRRFF